jgi:hypothetical protein
MSDYKIKALTKLNGVLCFLVFTLTQNAQDTLDVKAKFEPSFNIQLGYLPKTYPISPKTNHSLSSSIGLMWKLNGKDKWHQLYRFPKVGVELFMSDFGNPKEMGYSLGVVPTVEIKTKKGSKNFYAKYGFGMAYFNKYYNATSNPNNYYIGSSLTAMVSLNFMWKKRLTKNTQFTYGLSAFHYSNGHTQLPNVGLNFVVANVGLQFDKFREHKIEEILTKKNRLTYSVKLGLGRHEFGATEKAVGGPKYNSYHLSAWVNKPFKNIHLWQVGITAAYYSSFYDYIISQEVYKTKQKQKSLTGIIFIGHEFIFGKFSLSTQVGFYLYNPFFIKQKKLENTWVNLGEKIEAVNTNRFGIIYYPLKKHNTLNKLNNQLFMGVFIKANLFQADLFEYSLGFTF